MVYRPSSKAGLATDAVTKLAKRRRDTIVYVAGPYRGKSIFGLVRWWRQWRNIYTACQTAGLLWAMGYTVICPHTNTAWMDGVCPREWFLEGDLKILAKCDAVVLLRGYAKSEGTMGEIKFAIENDIPVFENIDALDKWVQDS